MYGCSSSPDPTLAGGQALPVGHLLPRYFKPLPQHLCFPKLQEPLWSSQIYYTSAARIQKAALPVGFKQTSSYLAPISKLSACYLVFNALPHYQCKGRYFYILIRQRTSSTSCPNTGYILLLTIVTHNQLGFFNLPNYINTTDDIYFVIDMKIFLTVFLQLSLALPTSQNTYFTTAATYYLQLLLLIAPGGIF